jgi:hypothetical protein
MAMVGERKREYEELSRECEGGCCFSREVNLLES